MPRDFLLYIDDILEALDRIKTYMAGMRKEDFLNDRRTTDAVIRNLEVLWDIVQSKLPNLDETCRRILSDNQN